MERHPIVVRLDVHLPDRHTTNFQNGYQKSAANMFKVESRLSDWFAANEIYPEANHLLYTEFAKYFLLEKIINRFDSKSML